MSDHVIPLVKGLKGSLSQNMSQSPHEALWGPIGSSLTASTSIHQTPFTSFPANNSLPPSQSSHSSPTRLVSLLFLIHAKHAPASGPLHMLIAASMHPGIHTTYSLPFFKSLLNTTLQLRPPLTFLNKVASPPQFSYPLNCFIFYP